jgi:AcrR family transcriptional regulator
MDHGDRRSQTGTGPSTDSESPADAPRKSRNREESRRRLIEAARDVFAQRGIRETPIELICERAGFTRGAFYSNYQSKEDLFFAVWEVETAERQRRVATAITATVDLPLPNDVDALRSVIAEMARRYIMLNTEDETWFALLLEYRLQGLRREELRPRVTEVYHQGVEEFATVIQQFVTRAGIRLSVDVYYVAKTVLALYNEALITNLLQDLPLTEDNEFLTEVIPRLLSGLLLPTPAAPGTPEEPDDGRSPGIPTGT